MGKWNVDTDGIDPNYHPSKEAKCRFPDDDVLRHHGFAIYARPDIGEPTWVRQGVRFRHSDALLSVRRETQCASKN